MAGGRKATFKPARALDRTVARVYARPYVDRVAEELAGEVRRRAPATKTWISQRDDAVRPQHRAPTDGQVVPSNLRFDLPSHPWDMGEDRAPKSQGKPRLGPRTYLLYPKDRSDPRVVVNLINCRCHARYDAQGMARHVRAHRADVFGTKVRGKVTAGGPQPLQAELGDVYPGGLISPGTFYVRDSVTVMRARLSRGR